METLGCTLAYGPNLDGLCEWDGQPIPAGRAQWCSEACRVAFREAHVWTAARSAALRRGARRCAVCGARGARGARSVQVHHDPPVGDDGYGDGCQHHPDRLVVLCHDHHAHRHRCLRAKLGAQLELFRAA